MRKLLSLALTAAIMLGLGACFGGDKPTTAPDTTPVQTTIATQEATPMPTADSDIEFTTQVVEAATDPDFDAEALFKRLEGVWNDNSEIPGFMSFIYKDGKRQKECRLFRLLK